MTKFEQEYKGYLITNQGLDSGYYVHTSTGMIWMKFLPDAYKYVDYVRFE